MLRYKPTLPALPTQWALTVLQGLAVLLAALPVTLPAQDTAQLTRVWQQEWPRTDFSRHAVDLREIVSGGPPKDGIPPIDKPAFVSPVEADRWLAADEPVLVFAHAGDARAYPLQILIWHEIVNDVVGDRPVAVTFCPLCNSALVFDRRVQAKVLDFGTTGKLRHSDLVMWDRQTESWWQQLTGEAIVGELMGTRLTALPAPLVAYGTFRTAYPQGRVLSRDTGRQRDYGSNPYVGYDNPAIRQPFLLRGAPDARLPAMERVVALELGGEAKAYPYGELAKVGAVNDRVGGLDVVVLHRSGTRSALDGHAIATSRDVGTGAVFERAVQGRTLTFELREGALLDRETGTRWSLLGQALDGPLQGQRLTPVVHGNHFAFAWLAFRPQSAIYRAP
jgi:hypothetical protein